MAMPNRPVNIDDKEKKEVISSIISCLDFLDVRILKGILALIKAYY